MELNNKAAEALLSTGNWEILEISVPVLKNKYTGGIKFPATDGSNLILDKYGCITTMMNIPAIRSRDNVNNNVLSMIVNEARDIFLKSGKEVLEDYIVKKNIPNDWRELIFKLIGLL